MGIKKLLYRQQDGENRPSPRQQFWFHSQQCNFRRQLSTTKVNIETFSFVTLFSLHIPSRDESLLAAIPTAAISI